MKRIRPFEVFGFIIILALTVFAGVSCTKADTDQELTGVTWVLQSYGNPDKLTTVIGDKELTLIFNKDKQEISGSGGINGYGGNYEVDGNKLTVSRIIHTLIASTNEDLNNQENRFFQILESSKTFKIDGTQLTITGSQSTLVFTGK